MLEHTQVPSASSSHNKLSQIASYILFALIGLSPLFFIPSSFYSLEFAKTSCIVMGILAIAIIQLIAAFKKQSISCTPKPVLIALCILAASIIASAVYSPTFLKSFFGQGFELNTGHFLLALILSIMVTYRSALSNIQHIFIAYAAVILSFLALYVYEIVRIIFGPDALGFSVFNSLASTPIGSMIDLGMYGAFIAILCLVTLKYLKLTGNMKVLVWVLFILSVIPALLSNSPALWASLIVTLGVLTAYTYTTSGTPTVAPGFFARIKSKISFMFVIPLLIALLYAFQGGVITQKANDMLGTGYSEVGLTWRSTLDVVVGSVKVSPLLGIGENRFVQAYTTFKPQGINATELWSLEFSRGYSWISTFVATQGFLGLIAWLTFFITCAYMGHKAFRSPINDPVQRYVVVSSYAGSVFLWLTAVLYTPSHTIMFMASVCTGLYVASLVHAGSERSITIQLSSWWTNTLLIVCGLLIIVWGIFGMRKIIGMSYFGAGVKHMTLEDKLDEADASFVRALSSDSSNIYWQARAEVAVAKIQSLISTINAQTNASTSASIVQAAGTLANNALAYTEQAIAIDPFNYYNYVSKARVAETATMLRMDNASEVAVQSYKQAIALNPNNPEIYLNLARFFASQKQYDDALQAVGASLDVKNNYIDAIFTLSQIQASKGDLKNAIASAQVATQLNPYNPLLFFQLGLLQYSNESYSSAVESFKKAVDLNQDYANARYFLGLSYARVGKDTEALGEFQKLAETNPDNQEVQDIIQALIAGKNIFKVPQIDNAEKSTKLPIEQE